MNEEAQRIAIAEACGWTDFDEAAEWDNTYPIGRKPGDTPDSFRVELPDYLNRLNAMHSAEKTLTHEQCMEYHCHLDRIQGRDAYDASTDGLEYPAQGFWFHATARQRAEAFLRTIGKWEDGK